MEFHISDRRKQILIIESKIPDRGSWLRFTVSATWNFLDRDRRGTATFLPVSSKKLSNFPFENELPNPENHSNPKSNSTIFKSFGALKSNWRLILDELFLTVLPILFLASFQEFSQTARCSIRFTT